MKETRIEKSNFILLIIITIVTFTIYFINPIFILNENQILYLFSAASQVIAAIFGLIITGYIFLRNELDRKYERDESYQEIITILKEEYFRLISIISSFTVTSIILCFLNIVLESSAHKSILDITINITGIIVIGSLLFIVSFILKILSPNSFEFASEELRRKYTTNENGERGSLEDFLKNYNEIEYILQKYGSSLLYENLTDYESIKMKRIPNRKLVTILTKENKFDNKLESDLLKLISLRNGIVHGLNPTISNEDELFSENVKIKVRESLNVNNN
ncbi:hypothetical protein MPF19_18875 [Polaribacter sp. Z014]|uniref:hypothetical protein n=1 Tax=Polaribacter sp. Z014 TaxID=2927126 RepID=UPI00201FBE87|nr:hypothetical protein [Polaribacter sp. Z014]MCL7765487.1 hypothetical protein [Polaribacter sp. Z014]